MSLMSMLYTGAAGLHAAQIQMDVAGHNNANMKTKGYTQQRANVATTHYRNERHGAMGTGVRVVDIVRVYDDILARTVRNEETVASYWQTTDGHIKNLMRHFDEMKNSKTIGENLQNYFDAWQKLASLPNGNDDQSDVKRINLVEISSNLTKQLRETYQMFKDRQKEIDESLKYKIDDINTLSHNIAMLNQEIVRVEAGSGHNANDLRDQRDILVDKLSKYFTINVKELDNGAYTVNAAAGLTLVDNLTSFELETKEVDGELRILWCVHEDRKLDITSKLASGSVGGDLDVRDNVIPKYMKQLDEFANILIKETNSVHARGQGLERFTNLTGSNQVIHPRYPLTDPAGKLPYPVTKGSFEIKVYDSDNKVIEKHNIDIDPNTDTLLAIAQKINMSDGYPSSGRKLNAYVTDDNKLHISSENGTTFAFGEDTSGFVIAAGLNNFFRGTGAADIMVEQNLVDNPSFVATNKNGDEGDVSNAADMVKIKYTKIRNGNVTIEQFYGTYNGAMAVETQQIGIYAKTKIEGALALRQKLESITGVNQNEVQSEIIILERVFQANSRYINTVDEMLNLIVNNLGLVGR